MLWSPPPFEDQNGVITSYTINVSMVLTGEVLQLVTNTTELGLDYLEPHSKYSVVVAAETRIGQGPFSSVLVFETKEDCESMVPVRGLLCNGKSMLLSCCV